MYVTQLRLNDLRTFQRCTIELCAPAVVDGQPSSQEDGAPLNNVTLLLGNNGAGKTTILRAVALGALAPLLPQSSGYVPRLMVRRVGRVAAKSASVEATLQFTEQDGLTNQARSALRLFPAPGGFQDRFGVIARPRWARGLWDDASPAFFIVGYGASRRVDAGGAFGAQTQERERNMRYLRVAGLFEESVVLRPLSSWLPKWGNAGRRVQLIKLLNQILPDVELMTQPADGEYLFRVDGSVLPFDALSDGYRAFIGWVVDLLYHVTRGVSSGDMLYETQGIVLVDEIDLHLHPGWQRTVIPRLARALPFVQFVFSSHSPLVVGTLHANNVRVVRQSPRGAVVGPPAIEVQGLSADQILTSEYFGLDSTRAPGFTERVQAGARAARRGDADEAQRFIRMLTLGAAGDYRVPSVPAPTPTSRRPTRGARAS